MENIYATSNNVEILRDRLNELSRIRQRYAAQLGSTLYAATKDNEELRWGNEALYDGIASCDSEREQIVEQLAAIASDQGDVRVDTPEPEPATEAEPEQELVQEPQTNELDPTESSAEPPVAEGFADEVADQVEAETTAAIPAAEQVEAPVEQQSDPVVQQGGPVVPEDLPVEQQPENEQVAAVSGRQCPQCGAAVGENDRFCMECGSSLVSAPAPVIEQKPCCPACGSEIDPSFKFCMICGHKLV